MFKLAIIVAPLALAGAAMAQSAHLSDSQYFAAARCQALMSSSNLGRVDTRAIDALLKSESGSRTGAAYDRAQEARDDASRAARHAGTYEKAALVSERDGVCRAFNGGATQSAAAEPAGVRRGN